MSSNSILVDPNSPHPGPEIPSNPNNVGVEQLLAQARDAASVALSEIRGHAEAVNAVASEAKKSIEAASAEIGEHRDAAGVAAASVTESQRLLAAARTEVETRLAEFAAVARQAGAAKSQITDEQAVIATKSEHIQRAQEHADKVRSDLDRVGTVVTQQATEAEGLRARAQAAADGAVEMQTAVRTSKSLVDADADAIATARDAAKESAALMKGMAERADAAEGRVAEYEGRLAELDLECKKQLAAIVELLPGATSAGLAHAFDARRQTFLKPSRRWQWLFVGSVGLLVGLTGWGLVQAYQSATYDDLWRLWLARLPVIAALVWLALHASRESALAKRMEEDYAYKAAIASSFQGFQQQMSEIGATAGSDTPLAKLCGDTLATIASPPGRIYDKHRLTATPADELKDLVKVLSGKAGSANPTER